MDKIAKREKSARTTALELIKKYEMNYLIDDENRLWVYLRVPNINKYFNGTDPWNGNHNFDSWQDLVHAIEADIAPFFKLGVQHG